MPGFHGVGVGQRVSVGSGVLDGGTVKVMVGVFVIVGVSVRVGVKVFVGVGDGPTVFVKVRVYVGERVGVAVGGKPVIVKRPESFQVKPMKTCTSYSPGSHFSRSAAQNEYPYPPVPPFHGSVSVQMISLSALYHKAVHCAPWSILS